MRTAVVRVDVDPDGRLAPEQLTAGMAALTERAADSGVEVIGTELAAMPVGRRQVRLLIDGTDSDELAGIGVELCANAFGTQPAAGVITYLSRGTDADAHGVLAAFGLSGEIERTADGDGLDVIHVTLSEADLQRVPESRIRTALESALNYEIDIQTV